MRARHRSLVEKSINAALAAIEIYNKPDFRYREDSFCILMQNAWELLLKARILKENKGNLRSIEVWEPKTNKDGTKSRRTQQKLNRSGNPLTIGFAKALSVVSGYKAHKVDERCAANLSLLVEIRDNSVHFVNIDSGLSQRIQEVGAAAVRNYMLAVQDWFEFDLSRYNFYLMPIAFHAPDKAVEALRRRNQPEKVRRLLDQIALAEQNLPNQGKDAFNVTMDIELRWTRARGENAIPVIVDPANPNAVPVTMRDEDYWARFWTYDQLIEHLRKRFVDFKQNDRFHSIRKRLMADTRYCEPRFHDPVKKRGRKDFYNPRIVGEFDKHYKLRTKT